MKRRAARAAICFLPTVHPVAHFSPAKINLFLAITGRRADGFHDLVSLVAPLDWGDDLTAEPADEFSLTCTDPAVPVDATNLVRKAAAAFRAATGWRGGAAFRLTKRIPMGAGLGGGSSNAVAALRALNDLAGSPLDATAIRQLAGGLGADCPLFAVGGPVIMRGRGERIEVLGPAEAARLRGRRVLVFKPHFGIGTAWAYGRMAANGRDYLPAAEAEARLAAWRGDVAAGPGAILFNNMEGVAFAKYLALPALHGLLRERFGLAPRMSGSGSASFVLLDEDSDPAPVEAAIREAWGPSTFLTTAAIA